jgi:hypothetical protein
MKWMEFHQWNFELDLTLGLEGKILTNFNYSIICVANFANLRLQVKSEN